MLPVEKRGKGLDAFYDDELGAELVEWMLLTLIVGLAGAGVLELVRGELSGAFERILGGFLGW